MQLLALQVQRHKGHGWFFTLEWTRDDLRRCLKKIGAEALFNHQRFHFDDGNDISAPYVIEQLEKCPANGVVAIDYLQLLDQKRCNDPLDAQLRQLKHFAIQRQIMIVLISQIDRSYDDQVHDTPTLKDLRLPNPIDTGLFDRHCFLHNGESFFSRRAHP